MNTQHTKMLCQIAKYNLNLLPHLVDTEVDRSMFCTSFLSHWISETRQFAISAFKVELV